MSKNSDRKGLNRLIVLSVFIVSANPAGAEGLDYRGSLTIGASNTDNVFLAAEPNTQDETIYQISPSLELDYTDQRTNALLRYRFDWYKYDDLGRTDKYHTYDANLIGEVLRELLFAEVGGSRTQSVVDPDGVIPQGNLPISNNLTDRDELYGGLRLIQKFGASVTAKANYRYTDVQFDETAIQSNINQTAGFELENFRREEGISWALRYDWRETEYGNSLPWKYRRASAELGWWIIGSTRIFASGGKESAWDDPIDRSLQDDFWEVGFAYRNGDRMTAELAAGKRSHGSSWRGKVAMSFPRGQLAFDYAETPTTSGNDRFARGSLLAPNEPNDYLSRPGSSQRFVIKRGQASLNLEYRRTTLGLVAFSEKRTNRTLADGRQLDDEEQRGVSASIAWQAGARTEIAVSTNFVNRQTETAGESDIIGAGLTVNYSIGAQLGLVLGYNYSEQDPAPESVGRDYVSNVVSLLLTYSF